MRVRLVKIVSMISALVVVSFSEQLDAQDVPEGFPRCELSERARERFVETYSKGHLAIASGDFDTARTQFELSLKLCMDDEVVWFLARVHERLGHADVSNNLDETWRTQRELLGLSTSPPRKPAWATSPTTPKQVTSLTLASTTSATRALSLPSVYKGVHIGHEKAGAFQFARDLARLSVDLTSSQQGELFLSDGTFLGTTPLNELMIPANKDLVILLKIDGKQVLARTVHAKPGSHQKLFLDVK